MRISDRTRGLGTEDAFTVLGEVNRLRESGHDVVNFCIGQPDFDTPVRIKRAAVRAIHEGKTGYTEAAGILELREAVSDHISKTRGIPVKPQSTVVTNGAKPIIGYSILSVTDHNEGHEVLYPSPGFPIYESQIRVHGARPVPLGLREERAYRLDPEELERKVNEKTRLLILNSPHNPTGGVLRKRDLEEVAEVVKDFEDLWILSDEVYSNMVHDDRFTSVASLPGMADRTIIMDSVSKTYAMTGWRIGFASNPRLAESLTRWVINTNSCAGHPSQYAALEALTGPKNDSRRMAEVFKRRRKLIVDGLNGIRGIDCLTPGGAFYAWPNVKGACKLIGAEDAEEFRKHLLYQAGVAVLSDIHFGPKVKGDGEHIRISYAASEEEIEQGLRKIRNYVEKRGATKHAKPLIRA